VAPAALPDEVDVHPLVADVVVVVEDGVGGAIAGSSTAPDDPLVSAAPAMPEAVAAVCAAPGPASATSSGRTIRTIRNSWAMAASDPNLTTLMRPGARRSSPAVHLPRLQAYVTRRHANRQPAL
jgi:hypothetical protein